MHAEGYMEEKSLLRNPKLQIQAGEKIDFGRAVLNNVVSDHHVSIARSQNKVSTSALGKGTEHSKQSVLYGLEVVTKGKPMHYSNQPMEPSKAVNQSSRHPEIFQRTNLNWHVFT